MLSVVSSMVDAYQGMVKHYYVCMHHAKNKWDTVFAKLGCTLQWSSCDLWIKGWLQHYGALKINQPKSELFGWMLQQVPIFYYLRAYEHLFRRLEKSGWIGYLLQRYGRTWQTMQAQILAFGSQLQANLALQGQLKDASVFDKQTKAIVCALYPSLVSALAMMMQVICYAISPMSTSLNITSLQVVLNHPHLGDQLLTRFIGSGKKDEKGVLSTWLTRHQTSWLDYLRYALGLTATLLLFYHGSLFFMYYPKRFMEAHWWWVIVAGGMLMTLLCDKLYRRYVYKKEIRSVVNGIGGWVKHDAKPSVKDAFVVSASTLASKPVLYPVQEAISHGSLDWVSLNGNALRCDDGWVRLGGQ